jgi:hypothetical protein
MDKKTHSVAVMNTQQKEFNEIRSLIDSIISTKKQTKPE